MPFVDPRTPTDNAAETRGRFRATYGVDPQVVAMAPGRVNLIGEHTDYNAGLVLPVALPHATYAAVATRRDDRVRIASADTDQHWDGALDTTGPGRVDGWAAYAAGVLWAMREAGYDVPGLDVVVHGTVPLGAGLSSSAALECSVALAVGGLLGVEPTTGVRRELVDACVRAESEVAGAPTGGMDQTVALLAQAGAALLVDFEADTTAAVDLPLDAAGLALLVTDTRVTHALVDGGYGDRRAECEVAVSALGVPSLRRASLDAVEGLDDARVRRRARHVVTEIDRVRRVVAAVGAGDWATVGATFVESHASMRDDFEISCAELDLAVETAVSAGAIGARMTGGGFGGSSVALVAADRVEAVAAAIDEAFARAGHHSPQHLRGVPSPAAALLT